MLVKTSVHRYVFCLMPANDLLGILHIQENLSISIAISSLLCMSTRL